MKKHRVVVRYFTIFSDEVDQRIGEEVPIPRRDEAVYINTKREIQTYRVEQVVWCVGTHATEVQVRLVPWTGETLHVRGA